MSHDYTLRFSEKTTNRMTPDFKSQSFKSQSADKANDIILQKAGISPNLQKREDIYKALIAKNYTPAEANALADSIIANRNNYSSENPLYAGGNRKPEEGQGRDHFRRNAGNTFDEKFDSLKDKFNDEADKPSKVTYTKTTRYGKSDSNNSVFGNTGDNWAKGSSMFSSLSTGNGRASLNTFSTDGNSLKMSSSSLSTDGNKLNYNSKTSIFS